MKKLPRLLLALVPALIFVIPTVIIFTLKSEKVAYLTTEEALAALNAVNDVAREYNLTFHQIQKEDLEGQGAIVSICGGNSTDSSSNISYTELYLENSSDLFYGRPYQLYSTDNGLIFLQDSGVYKTAPSTTAGPDLQLYFNAPERNVDVGNRVDSNFETQNARRIFVVDLTYIMGNSSASEIYSATKVTFKDAFEQIPKDILSKFQS